MRNRSGKTKTRVAATLLAWSFSPNVHSFCHLRNVCGGNKYCPGHRSYDTMLPQGVLLLPGLVVLTNIPGIPIHAKVLCISPQPFCQKSVHFHGSIIIPSNIQEESQSLGFLPKAASFRRFHMQISQNRCIWLFILKSCVRRHAARPLYNLLFC